MIGKSFEFNTQSIARTTADYQIGLDVVQWKGLDVSDSQADVQGFHGIKLSPTYARGRRITLEGIIIADDHEGSSKGIDFLETLFALQGIPSSIDLKSFIVTDEQDRRWELQCKIKETLSIDIQDDDYMTGAIRRWRVVLQSEDPRYYNVAEQTETGAEGYIGGVKLGTTLGVKLNEYFNEIQILANGNIESPLKITITATGDINTPLMVRNITSNTYFGLDIGAVSGDIIVIDSNLKTATKNGINILANRIAGSNWIKAFGSTVLSVYDEDGGLPTSDFDISISYRDVLL